MGASVVDEEREGELERSEMRNWRQMSKSAWTRQLLSFKQMSLNWLAVLKDYSDCWVSTEGLKACLSHRA